MRRNGALIFEGIRAQLAQVAFISSIVTLGFLLLFDLPW